MKFEGVWNDARVRLPGDGQPVAAAITGTYPHSDGPGKPSAGQDFWLVRPMVFSRFHFNGDSGDGIDNCFVDSDGIIRGAPGRGTDETVTHWAALPPLPGMTSPFLTGSDVRQAVETTLSAEH